MDKKLIFVANWKNYLSHSQAINFVVTNRKKIDELADNNVIVLCPPATAITALAQQLKESNVGIGGQDCASILLGAETGEISALSLKESGSTHCIIGHSEQRYKFYFSGLDQHQTSRLHQSINSTINNKIIAAISQELTPIICIGEQKNERAQGKTLEVISQQLIPALDAINKQKPTACFIAYEPIWAIGSGNLPTRYELMYTFEHIIKTIKNHTNHPESFKLLYGGSVASCNCEDLKQINDLDGFLIGRSSCDFQEFEKIVVW